MIFVSADHFIGCVVCELVSPFVEIDTCVPIHVTENDLMLLDHGSHFFPDVCIRFGHIATLQVLDAADNVLGVCYQVDTASGRQGLQAA